MDFQTAYNKYARPTIDTGEGLTEQSHKNECDINYILKEYTRTGLIRHANENAGRYDDIAVQDFHEAMNIVSNANSMFETLPALTRKRFENNPAAFLEFVQNPNNASEMARMGILKGNDGVDISGAPTRAPVSPQEATKVETPAPPTPSSE